MVISVLEKGSTSISSHAKPHLFSQYGAQDIHDHYVHDPVIPIARIQLNDNVQLNNPPDPQH